MSMLVVWCPNTVLCNQNLYASNLSTLSWFKMAGRRAHVAAAATTVLGIPGKPFMVLTTHYPSYIENGGGLLRLESLYKLTIEWGKCYRLGK